MESRARNTNQIKCVSTMSSNLGTNYALLPTILISVLPFSLRPVQQGVIHFDFLFLAY
jgi:hypothetical protein